MSSEKAEVQRQLAALAQEREDLVEERRTLPGMEMRMAARAARLRAIDDRIAIIDRDRASLIVSDGRLHDEEMAASSASKAASEQAKREDRSFWFRRFHTSLAIAHGAGFAAVSSKLFDPALKAATAGYAFYPMGAFAIGMVLAGLIPVALYRDAGRTAWLLAGASAFLFCGALIASLIAVWRQTGWPFP